MIPSLNSQHINQNKRDLEELKKKRQHDDETNIKKLTSDLEFHVNSNKEIQSKLDYFIKTKKNCFCK